MLHEIAQDLRYGWRSLLKARGFTIVAVLTLALGIGATSAIFSFVDGVLLRPLPYPHPDRLVQLTEKPPGGTRNPISALNFLDWQSQSTVFDALSATTGGSMTLSGVDEPVLLRTGRVSASYFDVYAIAPALGRTFARDEDEPGKDHVVVLSHALWATRFGGDPTLVGRTLTLDGEPYTVVGVMPEGSVFDRGFNQMWRPLAFKPSERTRNFHWLGSIGRLKEGVTFEQARSQLDAIGARIARDYPDSNKGWGVTIERYADIVVGPQLRQSLYVLLAAVGMLLLIGCANLANLTLARGTSREREVAVRAALGAGRARLVRQFLTENLLLAAFGGVAGIALGAAMMIGLKAMLPPFSLPRDATVVMDARILAFALMLSVATGVIFGLVPALHATRLDLAGAMKEGGRGTGGDAGRRRLRGALVVVEVALSFMLLTGAGLLVRSFFQMMHVELGFDATNVLTMRLPIATSRFATPDRLTAYIRDVVGRVSAVPGVAGAAAADALPLQGWNNGMPFLIAGRAEVDRANRNAAGFKMVQPEYFRVLGIRLLKGRVLTERDVKGSPPVAVINQTMASRYFANQDPIGQRLLIQDIVPGSPALGPEIPWEVVGVIADERTGSLDGAFRPGVYVTLDQSPSFFVGLVVRSHVEPESLQRAITQAVHELDKNQPVTEIRTLEQIKTESAAQNRLRTTLLGIFAILALVLSAVGIYGVISYSVAQRTHEIGIRSALGAQGGRLLRLVMGQGMALAIAGLALGFAGSLGLTRLLETLLFGVGARDPLTISVAASLLAGVALAACYVPARRAAKMDPLVALRET
jgi:putative ABC transport system permease protein